MGKLLLFVLLLPFVELYLLVHLGARVGLVPTLGVLIVGAVLGSLLMRRQGARVLRQVQSGLAGGQLPDEAVLRSGLVVVSGALIAVPGLLTDALGLALLLPPVRRFVARRLRRGAERQMRSGGLHVGVWGAQGPAAPQRVERRTLRGEEDAEFSEE
ncbi:FxsA family protein [Aggregicoccus sp. 17bor-14]|uniref:FxsA family protein n=1 Tax=Myxococcaceae TaxID=31 RepID=UPI0012F2B9CE|nr:FxsA family protein [Simulacricoccus sp. 17bor-14]MRI90189.1 FxsA family protein [Aggregicoccus sp. 17bor-14]